MKGMTHREYVHISRKLAPLRRFFPLFYCNKEERKVLQEIQKTKSSNKLAAGLCLCLCDIPRQTARELKQHIERESWALKGAYLHSWVYDAMNKTHITDCLEREHIMRAWEYLNCSLRLQPAAVLRSMWITSLLRYSVAQEEVMRQEQKQQEYQRKKAQAAAAGEQ